MRLTTPQQRVLVAVVAATETSVPFRPHGSEWPSVKKLVRDGLIERIDGFAASYRPSQRGREIAEQLTEASK